MIETLGLIGAVMLPFWNIPLIVRIAKRKSSRDLSLWWTFGILTCLLIMLPAGLASSDVVFKVFTVINLALFSAVVIQVMRYRNTK